MLKTFRSAWMRRACYLFMSLFLLATAFTGVSTASAHTVTTHSRTPIFTVAQDGSGNFTTVQAAVNAVPSGNQTPMVIFIKKGIYQEVVTVPIDKPFITFIGEDEKNTIITFNNFHGESMPGGGTFGTGNSASVFIQASDFTATNLTFQNTAGAVGQAVAVNVTGDRAVFFHCQFLGWQDTLYANTGRQYYFDDYIDGRVDYVFGDATAVFENSEFFSVAGDGGTLTAQRRLSPTETTGYVLLHDKIDGAVPNSTFLGRPWGAYSRVMVISSWIGTDIEAAGWENWSTMDNHLTADYGEFGNVGPGANTSGRIPWVHQLTAQEAQQFTVSNFLNQDGWLTAAVERFFTVLVQGQGHFLMSKPVFPL